MAMKQISSRISTDNNTESTACSSEPLVFQSAFRKLKRVLLLRSKKSEEWAEWKKELETIQWHQYKQYVASLGIQKVCITLDDREEDESSLNMGDENSLWEMGSPVIAKENDNDDPFVMKEVQQTVEANGKGGQSTDSNAAYDSELSLMKEETKPDADSTIQEQRPKENINDSHRETKNNNTEQVDRDEDDCDMECTDNQNERRRSSAFENWYFLLYGNKPKRNVSEPAPDRRNDPKKTTDVTLQTGSKNSFGNSCISKQIGEAARFNISATFPGATLPTITKSSSNTNMDDGNDDAGVITTLREELICAVKQEDWENAESKAAEIMIRVISSDNVQSLDNSLVKMDSCKSLTSATHPSVATTA